MNDLSSPDGLNFEPRAIEPESALVPGMAAPASSEGRTEAFGVAPLSMPPTGGPGPTALQEPGTWTYDFNPATGSSRATFTGEVIATSITAPGSGVTSFNTRNGAVVLTAADVTGVGGIVNPSPGLTGSPTAPTAAPGTSTTQIATTAFVAQAIVANPIVQSFNGRTGAVTLTAGDVTNAGGAPTSSPALTGTPTTPTPVLGDQSSKIASTQFVANAIAGGTVTTWNGRQGAVNLTLSDVTSVGGAPIVSPNFTGTPSGTTAAPGTATTQLATTAFVTNAVTAGAAGVASFNTRTGAVTLQLADVTSVGGAPLLSPTFTGTPAAPTPTAGDSSTRLATTAFVGTAIASLPSGVTTFNGRSGTVTLQLTDVTSVGGAPLASPTFSGTPKSVTPTPGDNSINIATTAFVAASFAPIASIPAAASTAPLMDGTAAVGTGTTWARADHVHPTDTTRYAASNPAGYQTAAQVTTSLGSYLPLGGGILTGNLTIANSSWLEIPTGAITIAHNNQTGAINITGCSYDTGNGLVVEGPTPIQVNHNAASGGLLLYFLANNSSTGSITNNATNTAYNTNSDGRLKQDKRPFDAGDMLDKLAVYDFEWIATGRRSHGAIAQEVYEVYPQAVSHDPERDWWGLDYAKFVPLLLAEIKTLRSRVAALEVEQRTA